MKKCPYCGKDNPDDATVCDVDQQPLDSETRENSPPEPPIDMRAYLAQRPWQVKLAVGILAANLLVGTIGTFAEMLTHRARSSHHFVYYFAPGVGFTFVWLLLYFIFRGKNWARWFFFGSIILGYFFSFTHIRQIHWEFFYYSAIDIAALILLFQRASSEWFTKAKYRAQSPVPVS
jgi:hypothetical protein